MEHEDKVNLISMNHKRATDILENYFKTLGYEVVPKNGSNLNGVLEEMPNGVRMLIPDMILKIDGKRIAVEYAGIHEYGEQTGGKEKIDHLLKHFDYVYHIPKSNFISFIFVHETTNLELLKKHMEEKREQRIKELEQEVKTLDKERQKYYEELAMVYDKTSRISDEDMRRSLENSPANIEELMRLKKKKEDQPKPL